MVGREGPTIRLNPEETIAANTLLLEDLHSALSQAIKEGIVYDTLKVYGQWEIIFCQPREVGLLPTVKHAIRLPGK